MNKTKRSNLITYAIVIVAFVVMQILSSTGSISSLLTGLLVPLCTYIILAVSLNLVVGILGELSLGHAGFMCVGAFSSAFFSKCMRDVIENSIVRFLLALLIGVVVAAIFGVIIGIPVLRLKGDYLAIVTLAFGEIIKNLVNVLYIGKDSKGFHFATKDVMALDMDPDGTVILNGPQGITGTPKDSTFLIGFILIWQVFQPLFSFIGNFKHLFFEWDCCHNININFSAWVVVAVVIATIWERMNMVYSSMPA